jgi:hypothetical protein
MVGQALEPKCPNLFPDLFSRRVAMLVEKVGIAGTKWRSRANKPTKQAAKPL